MVKVIKVIKFSNGTSETTLYYKTGLTPLMNSMQYGLAYSLTNLQIFIKESYGYDKIGNRASKTTNYGTIEYNYDRENRLLSS